MLRWASLAPLALALACRAGPRPLDTPEGALVPVDPSGLMEVVRRRSGRLVLVDLWATWCAPCVAELPDLLRIGRDYATRGLDLVLVSMDAPKAHAAAQRLLEAHDAPAPYYVAAGSPGAFIERFGDGWSGALPATALYDSEGTLLAFWEGPVDYATLRDVLEVVEWP